MPKIPLAFTVDRRDHTGYGLMLSKKIEENEVEVRKVDPYEDRIIKFDFYQLLQMLDVVWQEERKEIIKRKGE